MLLHGAHGSEVVAVGGGAAGAEDPAALAVLVVERVREAFEDVEVDGGFQFDRAVQEGGRQAGQLHGHLGERGAVALLQLGLLGRPGPVEAEADAVGVRDVVAQQGVGDEHDGGGAPVGRRLERDADVLPLGEPADHEEAEAVGVGELELRCLGEPEIGVQECFGRHAEAPVVDLQGEAVGDPLPHDLDGGVRR